MNSAGAPLVSILIRSMDRPTLERALRSAAAQSWPHLEIVVVAACGAAHRPLPAAVDGRPLRLVHADSTRRLARADAANVALDAAQGEWLNFLDDDDELLPPHVTELLAAARVPGERVAYGRTRVLDAAGNELGLIGHAGNHVQFYFHSRSTTCATLFHRSLIDEGARFDPDFGVHEDHDFFLNCATRTPFAFIDAATSVWHSQAGESGCGFGANDDPAQRAQAVAKIRQKWTHAFERWLQHFDAVLFAGQQYLKGGDLPAAVGCLEQALSLRPADVNALNLCGMANLQAGKVERAETLLSAALQRLPQHAGLRENLELARRRRAAR